MRRVATIQKDIKEYEALLSAEGLMDDEKKFLNDELKIFKDELVEAEKSSSKKAPTKKKAPAKKKTTSKKKAPTKKKTPTKKKEKAFITFEGKKIYEDDADYCEKLVEAWRSRKEKAKKTAKKRKTTPVIQRASKDVADAVTKVAKAVTKSEIKKDPKKAIAKIERVHKAAQEFINALEDAMGDEVTKYQLKEEFSGFDKVVEEIKNYINNNNDRIKKK